MLHNTYHIIAESCYVTLRCVLAFQSISCRLLLRASAKRIDCASARSRSAPSVRMALAKGAVRVMQTIRSDLDFLALRVRVESMANDAISIDHQGCRAFRAASTAQGFYNKRKLRSDRKFFTVLCLKLIVRILQIKQLIIIFYVSTDH